jgi:hypothetical protein
MRSTPEYSFVIADSAIAGSPGTWVFVPRNIAHAWRCDSAQGRVLNITTPGGFERFYREAGESVTDRNELPARGELDPEALARTAAKHGIAVVGPPLSEA